MNELERVGLWNETAGKKFGYGLKDYTLLIDQLKFIIEEVLGDDELYASYRRSQEIMTLDGCGDVLVTCAGVYHLVGLSDLYTLPSKSSKPELPDIDELVDELYFFMQDLQTKINNNALRIDQIEYISQQIAEEVINIVVDILHIKGYDPEQVLKVVNDSNFTKFCKDVNTARASVAAYKQKDRYVNVTSRKVGDYTVIRGDDKTNGVKQKILKGIHFEEPDFFELVKEVRPELL